MGIFSQAVYIDAVFLAIVDQTKPMRDQDHPLTDLVADLQFPFLMAGLGEDLYLLAVVKAHGLRINRVYGHGAGPFTFIPGGIPHEGVDIGVHVSARIQDQRKISGHL